MDNKCMSAEKKLCQAISIPTLSEENASTDHIRFSDFHDFLETSFPEFHKTTIKECIKGDALLFIWKGRNDNTKQLPFALLAHQDTVGIEEGTSHKWTYPPFGGVMDETHIWGRGALDDKCSLIGILEAAEQLICEGFIPSRDIYFCFGSNEETMATGEDSSAWCIASTLKERGIKLEFVLDEGGMVISDSFMGLSNPISTIGLAEKGYCDVLITVEDEGGHSSEPPEETSITKLGYLIDNLKKVNDKNVRLTKTVEATVKTIGSNLGGLTGFILRHPRGFFPVIKRFLLKDRQTAAMLRTTMVPTVLRAGKQPNAIPQKAEVNINVRILSGDEKPQIEERIRKAAGNNTKYRAEYRGYLSAMPETSSNAATYNLLSDLTENIHNAIPIPYLMIGGTDSRHYHEITNEIYRFYPFAMTFNELSTMHNIDERIRRSSFNEGIEYYKRFIMKSGE